MKRVGGYSIKSRLLIKIETDVLLSPSVVHSKKEPNLWDRIFFVIVIVISYWSEIESWFFYSNKKKVSLNFCCCYCFLFVVMFIHTRPNDLSSLRFGHIGESFISNATQTFKIVVYEHFEGRIKSFSTYPISATGVRGSEREKDRKTIWNRKLCLKLISSVNESNNNKNDGNETTTTITKIYIIKKFLMKNTWAWKSNTYEMNS